MRHVWTDALADFRRSCEWTDPIKRDYAHLKIWIVREQLGENEAANKELAAYFDKRDSNTPDKWPVQIANFLLGKISESDLIGAAVSPDAKKQQGQNSDVWFFAGMKRLLAGDKTGAADFFRKCQALNSKNCSEYYFARAELKALGQ